MYLSPDGIQPVEFGVDWACRLGTVRYLRFTGLPVVHVSPVEWQLDPQTIRQAAHDRRYVEIPPPDPSVLSFQYAPTAFPGTPFQGYPSPGPAPSQARRLAKKISGRDRMWISLRDFKLSREHVAEIASRARMTVVAEVADTSDRIMLLAPPGSPPPGSEVAKPRFRPGSAGFFTAGIVTTMALAIAGCAVSALTEHIWLTILSAVLGLPLLLLSVYWMRMAPKSVRAGWLASRFNGSRSVQFHPDVFGFTSDLAAQIAASHGYFYTAWARKPNGHPVEMVFVRGAGKSTEGTSTTDRTSENGDVRRS